MIKSNRLGNNRILLIPIIAIVIIALFYIGWLKPVEGIVSAVFRPFQSAGVAVVNSISEFVSPFGSVLALKQENQALRQENNELHALLANIQLEINEQQLFDEQKDFLAERGFNFVTAKVIGKTTEQSLQTISINAGSNSGIKQGQPVVIDDGILIGTVIKAENNHSEILLINDDRSIISAVVLNKNDTVGVVRGQFSANLKMELIPQGEPIDLNDMVITSGDEDNIPGGLVIGRVVEINNSPGELFQSALVSSLSNFEKLKIVSVIK
jgi:rod shape-determining protein MreC